MILDHQHLIVRSYVDNPPNDPIAIKEWLKDLIDSIGMKVAVGLEANPIAYYCDLENNKGLTGLAILETSHCAIHVWDEDRPALVQFDLYSCSKIDPKAIFEKLSVFKPVSYQYKFIDRANGLIDLDSGNH